MDPKYTFENLRSYYTRYIREYRAISVLWGILTILWCILNVVCFIQPQWIGDTPSLASGYGHIGLYKYCQPDIQSDGLVTDGRYKCNGYFGNFGSIQNDSLRAATFFVGISSLLMLATVAGLLLFSCLSSRVVFIICGILEVISAIFMFLGCVIFPNGWTGLFIKKLCGEDVGSYKIGACGVRWAYILAIVGVFDAAILACLAFVLASKSAKLERATTDNDTGTVTKSAFNGYTGDSMSKHSVPIQPMVVLPGDDHDRYSEFSHRSAKSKRSGFQL